jgi:beta-lactamase regulating signal transducer with metallopeptidase domain
MNFIPELASVPEVHRLGWTLLHFLWQGAAVALLFGLACRLSRRASSQSRYLAGCTALALLCAAPLITFSKLPAGGAPGTEASNAGRMFFANEPADPVVVRGTSEPSAIPGANPRGPAIPRPDRVLPLIVVLWAAGVLLFSIRLLCSWGKVRALVRERGEPISAEWRDCVARLKERLRVSRPVRVVRSMAVEVPTVAGWLKPVILLPASSLTGLTPQQLEAVLAHELAHIRRQDYLVNLIQNVAETFLFYHPAVWWISGCIRRERELCCDDEAVRTCGDALLYARALTALEELRTVPPGLAQAADGGSLLDRVRRLAAGRANRPRAGWGATGSAVLLVLLGLGLIVLPLAHGEKRTPEPSAAPDAIIGETEAAQPSIDLVSRDFRLDPGTVRKKLSEVLVIPSELSRDHDATPLRDLLREFFQKTDSSVAWPGTVLFDENTGLLRVHATPVEMEKIMAVLAFLNKAQIMIEVRIVEGPPSGIYRSVMSGLPDHAKVTSFLKPQHYQLFSKPSPDKEVLFSSRVTTLSERQAQVALLEAITVVTEYIDEDQFTSETVNLGYSVDMFATMRPDGFSINLRWDARIMDFIGYDPPFDPEEPRGPDPYRPPSPVRIRAIGGAANIWDGSTVMSYWEVTDGKAAEPGQAPEKRQISLFLTPRIIDPAGNPVHTDEEIERHWNLHGPPKQ